MSHPCRRWSTSWPVRVGIGRLFSIVIQIRNRRSANGYGQSPTMKVHPIAEYPRLTGAFHLIVQAELRVVDLPEGFKVTDIVLVDSLYRPDTSCGRCGLCLLLRIVVPSPTSIKPMGWVWFWDPLLSATAAASIVVLTMMGIADSGVLLGQLARGV